ncbi:glycerol-3-phosphate acyltransferase [Subdoligranulum variabile]|uniref:Acyl-phosphate glycerol 3-phosphate acyltransferase n=1 Tax=Subdoligranulum variabile DSM 15176 TaxID=411471 RepID=D1PL51_9FIRM|nr:glycerol-3-phosphate acyltransferase [Subdoligranulum variabile]EFB76709.1 putative acyl-phosphate glycerol 3-phosphate acyltransferase [Subdoligranulum variabile DSM 15176]UWP68063.1 glycerol-3-phosphate acyltransferase [Subdoligranulum variabile]
MPVEQGYLLKVLCLLAGYAFGCFLTAEIVARCLAGVAVRSVGNGEPNVENIARRLGKAAGLAVVAGDILKTVLACWFCYRLAAPELEHVAVLYGGVGAVLGHAFPVWRRGRGGYAALVAATWLVVYLPITGALCCLAGAVATIGTKRWVWGSVLAALLAIPVAFLQFGAQSGSGAVAVLFVLLWQCRTEIFPFGAGGTRSCRKKD